MIYAYYDESNSLVATGSSLKELGEKIGLQSGSVSYRLRQNHPQYARYDTDEEMAKDVQKRTHKSLEDAIPKADRVYVKYGKGGVIMGWAHSIKELADRLAIDQFIVARNFMHHTLGYAIYDTEEEMREKAKLRRKRPEPPAPKESEFEKPSQKAVDFEKIPAYAGTSICPDPAWRPGTIEWKRRRGEA